MEKLFENRTEPFSELSDIDQFCKDDIKFSDLFDVEVKTPN